jgi:hypothetical protein
MRLVRERFYLAATEEYGHRSGEGSILPSPYTAYVKAVRGCVDVMSRCAPQFPRCELPCIHAHSRAMICVSCPQNAGVRQLSPQDFHHG